jgi:hypothetical protein
MGEAGKSLTSSKRRISEPRLFQIVLTLRLVVLISVLNRVWIKETPDIVLE